MKVGTINKELSTVRRVLMLAARVWRDENGLSWLSAPPLTQMMTGAVRKPYPLSWQEQWVLFPELPKRMALRASEKRASLVGLGGARSGARHDALYHPGTVGEEWAGTHYPVERGRAYRR